MSRRFWISQIDRTLERGVSVGCRGQIFYIFGCRHENHSVECRLGIVILSFMLCIWSCVSGVGINFECRVSGIFCPQCRVSDGHFWQCRVSELPLIHGPYRWEVSLISNVSVISDVSDVLNILNILNISLCSQRSRLSRLSWRSWISRRPWLSQRSRRSCISRRISVFLGFLEKYSLLAKTVIPVCAWQQPGDSSEAELLHANSTLSESSRHLKKNPSVSVTEKLIKIEKEAWSRLLETLSYCTYLELS